MNLSRYGWFASLSHGFLGLSAQGVQAVIVNSWSGVRSCRARACQPASSGSSPTVSTWNASGPTPRRAKLLGLTVRLDPMKDHSTLSRGPDPPKAPQARFACRGGGPTDLATQARDLGLEQALIWVGARRDMPAVMNALDVCVLSSAFGKGLPNVVG
ncbi:hypothetical protein DFAR_150007 [Desulfarculales bacterium]